MEEHSIPSSGRQGTTEVCACKFGSVKEKEHARRRFLEDYGEDLPEEAIVEALSDKVWNQWVEYCDCKKPNEIVAGIHYVNNDWYLCTLKDLAVNGIERKWLG